MKYQFVVTVETDDSNDLAPTGDEIASEIKSDLEFEAELTGVTKVEVDKLEVR